MTNNEIIKALKCVPKDVSGYKTEKERKENPLDCDYVPEKHREASED